MLGCVVNLEAFCKKPRLFGLECFVERTCFMGVQIVAYKAYQRGLRVVYLKQLLDLMRPVNTGSAFAHIDMAPAGQRFDEHEDVAGSIAFVFIVHPLRFTCRGGHWYARFLYQLARLFIHTHHVEYGGHMANSRVPKYPPCAPQTPRSAWEEYTNIR